MKRYLVTLRAYYPVLHLHSKKRISHYESLIMQEAVTADSPQDAVSFAIDDLGVANDVKPPKLLTVQEVPYAR